MSRVHLGIIFLLDLALFLYCHFHFPQVEWIPLAGFFTCCLFRSSHLFFLLIGTLLGLGFDIFSLEGPFGNWTISILGSFFILKRVSNYFYEDKMFSLPILCALFCITISAFSLVFLNILDKKTSISYHSLTADFLYAPFIEATLRIVCIQVPLMIILYAKKMVGRFIRRKQEETA